MSVHWQYACYLARHKTFVLRAGLRTDAPLWRLLMHDWSKLLPDEWWPYAASFYGPQPRPRAAFERAWLAHQHRNKHHWQHWVLRNDDGTSVALPMPDKYRREMLADWMGAGRAITGRWEVREWYERNRTRLVLHDETRRWIEEQLGLDQSAPS